MPEGRQPEQSMKEQNTICRCVKEKQAELETRRQRES